MFVISNFFKALANILDFVLYSYMIVVIARAVLSWVSPDPYNPIVRFLYNVTEPILYRIRRVLPFSTGGIDFTPMILILVILFLRWFLVPTLYNLGSVMGD